MTKLKSVDAETLLYKPLDPTIFIVEGLIPCGLTLFCGSQKIGKSWLMLDLCCKVSSGQSFWDCPTRECDVLYLCLEDTVARIQNRLFTLVDEASPRLRFSNELHTLGQDLIEYLEDYFQSYPELKLIVIDTLQKIRDTTSENAYAHDYGDLSKLKLFADRHQLAIVVVHHVRKAGDADVFNQISGTMGLAGCADASFVLKRESRAANTARLFLTGRDVEYQEFELRFNDCRWELIGRKTEKELTAEQAPDVLYAVLALMESCDEWHGTASELLETIGVDDMKPMVLAKYLNQHHFTFLADNQIEYSSGRTHEGRYIRLRRKPNDGAAAVQDDAVTRDAKYKTYPDASPSRVTESPDDASKDAARESEPSLSGAATQSEENPRTADFPLMQEAPEAVLAERASVPKGSPEGTSGAPLTK